MTLDAICGDFTWLRQIGEGRTEETEGKPWEKKLGFVRAVTAVEQDTSKLEALGWIKRRSFPCPCLSQTFVRLPLAPETGPLDIIWPPLKF